ncbi:MAG: DUF523 domain-containing protein [Anaerostipes sp.]|jgi:uncharacterized protein YbbK (DUF523 family)|nr:DUF523 domain-containing protein [Anaerostipes sp.]
MHILVSACLLGVNCKYNHGNNENEEVKKLMKNHCLIPVCPEIMGGLPTPRVPSEIKGDKVVTETGKDVTKEFEAGARETLKIAKMYHCKRAILKEKSPSCGCGQIYDGTFSHTVIEGDGLTARLLKKNGITIQNEHEICGEKTE